MGAMASSTNTAAIEERISGLVKGNKVMVFSKTYCPFCTKAKQILKSAGIDFKAYELDKEADGASMQN